MKESRCYNVSILINHHQELKKDVIECRFITDVASFLSPVDGLLKPKRYNVDFLL